MSYPFFSLYRIQNPSFPVYISPDSLLSSNRPPFSRQINELKGPWLPGCLFWPEWFLPVPPASFHRPDLSGSFLMEWKLSARFVNRREARRLPPRSGVIAEWQCVCLAYRY